MNTARGTKWTSGLLAAVVLAATAQVAAAQSTKMPSTLRYGSGYLDVPSASVLPHLAIQGTYSGFWASLDRRPLVDDRGVIVGSDADGLDKFHGNASIGLGLFDRVEVGASLHSFNDADQGGNLFGAFGQIALLRPAAQGLGLAVGARYAGAPDYDDGVEYAPNRLGFPDRRLRAEYEGGYTVDTELTLYAVSSVFLRGFDSDWFPAHDWTLSLGFGNGQFNEGEKLDFYRYADSEGVFAAAVMHTSLGEGKLLNLMGEYNGFDVNVGAQLDLGGFRIGAHLLGANYLEELSIYRSAKFGILGSVALCPQDGFLCSPSLMEREAPDTVRLPAPPPDTVVVTREVGRPLPEGNPASICLATGQDVQILLTAQGDTLVGPDRTSIRQLRPGVVFAGAYAEGRAWFTNDESIAFEDASYDKSGDEVSLQCPNIMRVGEHMGVPLFVMRNAERPFETLYVPVRPGVWQAYQTGLQRTRGD
ncbi:MAG: hypothetical protein RLN75_08510 [Longimicrobiales bacterium]